MACDKCCSPPPDRRGFLKGSIAAAISVVLGAVPFGAGLAVLFSPLKRKAGQGAAVQVASLNGLPADGSPRKFRVVAERVDAWNRSKALIGAVYLRRVQGGVLALNVACPHAGCFVDYSPDRNGFFCPCHNSVFALDGAVSDPKSPAPRGMDALDVEIRNGDEIWVKFQNYRAGEAKKEAV